MDVNINSDSKKSELRKRAFYQDHCIQNVITSIKNFDDIVMDTLQIDQYVSHYNGEVKVILRYTKGE